MSLLQNFTASVQNMVRIPELRRKLGITLGLLAIYRIGFFVPIPGVNTLGVGQLSAQHETGVLGGIINLANLVSGGRVLSCTLFSLGIMPYISASIIMQLLTKVLPSLEAMQKEGESGRRKINQWTRYVTILIGVIQSSFMLNALRGVNAGQLIAPGVGGLSFVLVGVLSLTTGTLFLMWLGEKITDHGIGNGASIIIMSGIVSGIPNALLDVGRQFNMGQVGAFSVLTLIASFLITVSGVIFITQGQRRIPIQQAKHTRGRRVYGGQRHFLPLRVNMAGVMPIIFASALLMFPQMGFNIVGLQDHWIAHLFTERASFVYVSLYVALTFFFSFFWNQLIFNPLELANNLKEYGSFIPGVRPGKKTAEYLEGTINRITLAGAGFLSFIAVAPIILLDLTNIAAVVYLGGTSILIVVGVALDVIQKIESHLLMRHYKGFLGGGGIRGRQ